MHFRLTVKLGSCFYHVFFFVRTYTGNFPIVLAEFNKDANAQIENGNKAAGTRARKASLEIEKAMKEFRKVSLEESKK